MEHKHPSQARYPPQRVSPDLFQFQHLPAELRRRIIELSLPSINDVSRPWPAPIPALLATSKQINTETREVMKTWSPVHYVPSPDSLHMFPMPDIVKVERICLSMFHDARIGVLRSGPMTRSFADDHQDLIFTWMENVSKLPVHYSIKTIIIDATPAPGWMRYEKPSWVNSIINDRAVSARFLYEHIAVIADLMANITEKYHSLNHDINIELAGVYGHESSRFPTLVRNRCAGNADLDILFTGDIVPDINDHRTPMTVEHAISELYPGRSTSHTRVKKENRIHGAARRRLLSYDFTPTTEFLFASCYEDSTYWTMHQLKRITNLVLDDKRRTSYVDISIADFAQGSLICSLAKDLRLSTSPRTSWRRQKIRVVRQDRKIKRGVENTKQSSSLLGFLLVSAAVVLVIGMISNHHNRRRR